jgi:Uma2 family endonuclease
MPAVLGETVYTPPAAKVPPRVPWTREEVEACIRAGLWAGQHYELVDGELINKSPKYLRHVRGVQGVFRVLVEIFGWGFVLTEPSVDVAAEDHRTSEPEPDVVVLNRRASELPGDEPEPPDIALVVEVSDTTLHHDLTTKAALYARAGIPDYWVLDLNGRRLVVHREPARGVYKAVMAYDEHERVAPLAAPGREIAIADLLSF